MSIDTISFNITLDPAVALDLGVGDDTVTVSAGAAVPQVRLTFTSAEVGNGNALDSNSMANQDGGLAVRMQAEDGAGNLTGAVSRFDDEGIAFVSDGTFTFDVRDLVSGVQRGDQFDVVVLGTQANNRFDEAGKARAYYINAGQGNDTVIGGLRNDFLVGGAGDDLLQGREGDDAFIGGGGSDRVFGGAGADTAIFNISTDGADATDLGTGLDVVTVAALPAVTQVRVSFTSAEVGNGNARDSNTLAGQDGGLALRLQAEDGTDMLTGAISRFDDEGVQFVSNGLFTFDVRDLVSGIQRGDGFAVVQLGTSGADRFDETGEIRSYYINAGQGNDTAIGGTANDFLVGGAGNDLLIGNAGDDSFIGGGGNDTVFGGGGSDRVFFNLGTDGVEAADLGSGLDAVSLSAGVGVTQLRLTFTSAEVGNGNARDGNTLANQDGGLAVRVQAEDGTGALTGAISRFDDEGIEFVGSGLFTFDVRDLVSGVQRGDQFDVVVLGTSGADRFDETDAADAYYINAGMGNDTVIGGAVNDFLVGGAGDDLLQGREGDDAFIGGGGSDRVFGGAGADTAIFNISTDGADATDLGTGLDTVSVAALPAVTQVRVTFTSSEVGNDSAFDSNTMANQDGGLAVRLQAEDGMGALTGAVGRFDDEGIEFVSNGLFTFDVRDLVSGVQRGDQFDVVVLGTQTNNRFDERGETDSYYINAGMGHDTVIGGAVNDFLVGGAGNDLLQGREGDDAFIGGGGNDTVFGGNGDDTAIFNLSTDGSDAVDLGVGQDTVNVAALPAVTQVRLTFTSAEVGNGSARDSNTLANQDGGLAVRLQAEDGADMLTGAVSRFDDEGMRFVAGAGFTFDVRDLVSGVQRGDQFDVVDLGTRGSTLFDETGATESYYINAGRGHDTLIGGAANDFLVGGADDDVLDGQEGDNGLIGGTGSDTFVFSEVLGIDRILDFVSGTDRIDLRAFGIGFGDVTTSMAGADTMVAVDVDGDMTADLRFTLVNAAAPVEADYIFV